MPAERWLSYVQRLYLRNLDWALMTYAAIVGLSYALGVLPGVAGARTQGGAARDQSHGGAAEDARSGAPSALPLQHAARDLDARAHESGGRRPHDQPAQRPAAPHVRSVRRRTASRCKEELEFLQKYLEIEQTRFQDRLAVQFDIDPETLDAEVPRLILQPLVENAIKHGIAPRAGQRAGADRRTARSGRRLWIEVRDNGVGLSRNARDALRERRRPVEHARRGSNACTAASTGSSSPTGGGGLVGPDR